MARAWRRREVARRGIGSINGIERSSLTGRKEKEKRRGKAKRDEVKTNSPTPCWFGELKTGAAADMIRSDGVEILSQG